MLDYSNKFDDESESAGGAGKVRTHQFVSPGRSEDPIEANRNDSSLQKQGEPTLEIDVSEPVQKTNEDEEVVKEMGDE